jgi:hypothetical protein
VVQGCGVFSCDADFTCQQVPGEFLDPDASCDDGVVCTEGDKCLQGGECRGIPIDALCPEGQRCDADAGCQSP